MKTFTDYADFLARIFPGLKVQKLSIDAGHSCPNRDGTLGHGGCLYCNNSAFSPAYCHEAGSIASQIEAGKHFFARKYPHMQFLAYFQAYTPTHAPLPELIKAYEEAMSCPGICGLVIGTRPDCMPGTLLSYLADVNASRKPVIIEYGVETMHDATLKLINRRHSAGCSKQAILRTINAGLPVGAHLIMGLPGETRDQMLDTIREVCSLGTNILKLHQLQIVKGTPLHRIWLARQTGEPLPAPYPEFPEITTFDIETYIDLCAEIVGIIPRSTAIERFTAQCPPHLLAAPRWGLKNYQFTHRLLSRIALGNNHDTKSRC